MSENTVKIIHAYCADGGHDIHDTHDGDRKANVDNNQKQSKQTTTVDWTIFMSDKRIKSLPPRAVCC